MGYIRDAKDGEYHDKLREITRLVKCVTRNILMGEIRDWNYTWRESTWLEIYWWKRWVIELYVTGNIHDGTDGDFHDKWQEITRRVKYVTGNIRVLMGEMHDWNYTWTKSTWLEIYLWERCVFEIIRVGKVRDWKYTWRGRYMTRFNKRRQRKESFY
jgi:hypothetical protein